MERSSRRERSRDPEDGKAGTGYRLRSRRIRDARISTADFTSDGADTDVSSAGHNLDVPSGRQRRRKKTQAEEETQTYERQSGYEDDEEEDVDMEDEVNGSRRKRSMSNVSNHSSTSASFMTSESMTDEQRCARLDQYME
ncbi:hypothetical protein PsorP6_005365 [Peronosclerospora sorghi]|uniref:Uncharacterized protein n=1 Tax=Peronosclerospora sorghi TaxID=230839 RepID=A0ACC0W210_9STRA|nr:hypothetical protein PsorP6_005365 [Peronosclerospora sorghi]